LQKTLVLKKLWRFTHQLTRSGYLGVVQHV